MPRKRPPAAAPDGPTTDERADAGPLPSDRSGWTAHPSERRDFYHRIRFFPPEVAAWRRELLKQVEEHPVHFPQAAVPDRERTLAQIDQGISFLREIARILAVLYGSPDLGNKHDPTDELVYIIVARHTREGAYQATFERLKQRFPAWDQLLAAPRREVRKLVHAGALSSKKTATLSAALGKLRQRFGACTLEPARAWSAEEHEAFICLADR